MIARTCQDTGAKLIDTYSAFIHSDGHPMMDLFHRDGIHLNQRGSSNLVRCINKYVPIVKPRSDDYRPHMRARDGLGQHARDGVHGTRTYPTRLTDSVPHSRHSAPRHRHSSFSHNENRGGMTRENSSERYGSPVSSSRDFSWNVAQRSRYCAHCRNTSHYTEDCRRRW